MAKIHKIRGRMKSVVKIQQITKAMEKVAASKMRRAQQAALRTRPYSYTAREILTHLFTLTSPNAHPLFAQRDIKRRLLIIFSSDRGLAGAYNSNINRLIISTVDEAAGDEALPQVMAVGRKGAALCAKLERAGKVKVLGAFTDWAADPAPVSVQPITSTAITLFTEAAVDVVSVIYTDFVSGLQQIAAIRQLLPIKAEEVTEPGAPAQDGLKEALFEPTPQAVLAYLVPQLVNTQLYQASLEAVASEHSMRMIAMKSASDNAGTLLDDLALTYNSARQAAITQELAEISAGAEAVR